jgi:hypothetical protein
MHTCVDESVEMTICVFEGESVRVGKVVGDKKVELCWEGH